MKKEIIVYITIIVTKSQSISLVGDLIKNLENFQSTIFKIANLSEKIMERIETMPEDVVYSKTPEDGRLNFIQIASKYGYQCEQFDVVTKDGYILKLFHIPGDESRPVLLNHGLADTADTFIIRNNNSLVFTLASLKYDVWAMNQRGNRYSRRHTTLDPNEHSKQFFNFSFNEIGMYDIPANIDYVLQATKAEKLSYIGNSQGTASFFVMASEIPKYNDKVLIAIMFAPIAFVQDMAGVLAFLAPYTNPLTEFGNTLGLVEIGGYSSTMTKLFRAICSEGQLGYQLCTRIIFETVGYDPEQIDMKFLNVALGHFPAGTSVKSLIHYGQMNLNKRFCKYDYGEKNIDLYGSENPPDYDLGKVTAKIALFRAKNDRISTLKDVTKLRSRLPNVVEDRTIENKLWTHLDYTWARDLNKYLHPHVIEYLDKHGQNM